jgi:hypothetical protein
MLDSLKCRRETKSFLEELRNSLKQFSVQSKKSNSNVKKLRRFSCRIYEQL